MVLTSTSVFCHQLTVRAGVGVIGNYFNENVSEWEPLIEPVEDDKQVYRHWELNLEVTQAVPLQWPWSSFDVCLIFSAQHFFSTVLLVALHQLDMMHPPICSSFLLQPSSVLLA